MKGDIMEKEMRYAVLIDSDNVAAKYTKFILDEVSNYGVVTYKRVYGDWTRDNSVRWKTMALENAITPVQQYSYTTGKNSTDSAMIIDAMDILYEGKTDGFCIVSSDSDFTRLAIRLREAGMKVIGMGEQKTPVAFRVACDRFIYIENIRAAQQEREKAAQAPAQPVKKAEPKPAAKKTHKTKAEASKTPEKPAPAPEAEPELSVPEAQAAPAPRKGGRVPEDTVLLIAASVSDLADEDGWASMAELGNLLLKKQPDFDPRNFGFAKLTPLIRSLSRFEIDARVIDATKTRHIYLRDQEA